MPRKITLSILILLTCAAVFGIFSARQGDAPLAQADVSAQYQEFKTEYAHRTFQDQHLGAHEWGRRIYDTLGTAGVAVCDSSFGFGCYHSFFGQALSSEGSGIIAELDRQCIAKYGELGTGCQHGIGHGLVEYYGPDRLAEALQECKSTAQKNPLFGCSSGAFMEYNTPILIGDNTAEASTRPLDQQQLYAPCPEVLSEFRLSCFFELPKWWSAFLDAAKSGELCASVTDSAQKEVCFLGLGDHLAAMSQYDAAATIEKCAEVPGSFQNLCRAGAGWSFFSVPEQREHAGKLCAGLPEGARSQCLVKSRPICNYLSESKLKAQCLADTK